MRYKDLDGEFLNYENLFVENSLVKLTVYEI